MAAILLIQFALKGAIVLAVTWLAAASLRRGSAASRHLVWALGLAATLALPFARAAAPTMTVAVPGSVVPETAWFAVTATIAEPAPPQTGQEGAVLLPQASAPAPDPAAALGTSADAALARTSPRAELTQPPASAVPHWSTVVVALWLGGACVLLLRLGAGFVRAQRIAKDGTPVDDDEWLKAFDEAAAILCVDRRVELRMARGTSVPVACGIVRPAVLLPDGALAWPAERRLIVLLHELAHVRRRDCLVQAMAQVTCALHWFNPLAHVALARIRAEQERACDDLVLSSGASAPDYADHLFEIARSFRAPGAPAWATLAMARPSQLEGRLMAILDDRCNRATASRRARLILGLAALAGILLLGALHVTAESPQPLEAPSSADVVLSQSESTPIPAPAPAPEPGAEPSPAPLVREPGVRDRESFLPNVFALLAQAAPAAAAQQPAPVTDDTRRRVADALATALDDENVEVRQRALEGLASMRDARAVPALLKAMRDPNAGLRESAIEGLARFDTAEARDGVVAALKDAAGGVRERAAIAVGRTRNRTAVPALLPLLKDADGGVRERAALALGMIADPAAIDGLTAALKDADAGVREQAAMALGMIARGQRRGPGGGVPPVPPAPPVRPIGGLNFDDRMKEFERDMQAFQVEMKAFEKEIEASVADTLDATLGRK